MHMTGPAQAGHGYLVPKRQAWIAFALAFLLMTFDFIDRQIIVSMFPYLKADWGLSDTQLGALTSVVSVTIAVFTFPLSLLIDRWSRVKSVVAMGIVWSLATIACGFATTYQQLLIARGFIGLGEAGYGPAAGAILSSMFPTRMRATIIGGFLAAASFGAVLGVVLGGVIAARWGWQSAFGIVGVPGLVVAVLFMYVRDYRAPELKVGASQEAGIVWAIAAGLFCARSGLAACFAGALQVITASTVIAWLPSYFNRIYGQPADRSGVWAAAIIICATAGAVVWANVADRFADRDVRFRMLTPAACSVVTLIVFATAFGALNPGPLQIAMLVLGAFVMTGTTGPVPAVVIDVVHPALRSTAGSVVAVIQNLFGLGLGLLLSGALSDAFGLQAAMAIMPVSSGLAALLLVLGSRFYPADRAAVTNLQVRAEDLDVVPQPAGA
ncbi:MFS transporter [Bradyrhizobium sp. STM 3561]|uniref:MFS transporter n=1 Tax=unclassified Bradyrhizobium TaxID=2631580 RepID=UPI00388DB066